MCCTQKSLSFNKFIVSIADYFKKRHKKGAFALNNQPSVHLSFLQATDMRVITSAKNKGTVRFKIKPRNCIKKGSNLTNCLKF